MDKKAIINDIKKWLTRKNLVNGLFYMVLLLLLVNPSAKAMVIQGLMKLGLFQPRVSSNAKPLTTSADVNFIDEKGKSVSLPSLKGKVVFINFWATWCPPCIAELPAINELHKQLTGNKNIVFLLVDADNNLKKSLPFMASHHFNLPVYMTSASVPGEMMGNSIPSTVVLNKQGQIIFHHEGAADYTNQKFAAYLKKLSEE
jgi:thiol-disulfide isomerase/thioredoxin